MASGREHCPMLLSLWDPFGLLMVWEFGSQFGGSAPNVQSSKSLDLVAIDVTVVAMN